MLTTHAIGSATMPLIASCLFVFRVVGFIIDDLEKKKKTSCGPHVIPVMCLPYYML